MICDKCGFEHNNRSTCPKCGARVVFVNEEYLKRKKEWEEAEKNGKADGILPGIMHSTKAEHDISKGRDRMIEYKEGGPETASLSFDVVKKKLIERMAKIVAFFQKHKRKRGRDNPVITEINFDDEEEDDLDSSKLVLSHKVFRDKRKPIIIGVVAAAIIVVMAVTLIKVITGRDTSKVFYFDGKYGYYSTNEDKTLFGDLQGDIRLVHSDNGHILAESDDSVYIYRNGKEDRIEAKSPEIITYSDNLKLVIFTDGNKTVLYSNGDTMKLSINPDASFTSACAVSPGGKYFTITTSETINDVTSFSMYYGTDSGEITVATEDEYQKEIAAVTDDGAVYYIDMETAEYGIVNAKTLKLYADETITKLSDSVDRFTYYDNKKLLYYITEDGNLYKKEASTTSIADKIDKNVTDFAVNGIEDKKHVYYIKEDAYYMVDLAKDSITKLFSSDMTATQIYYYPGQDYVYSSYADKIYYGKVGSTLNNKPVATLLTDAQIVTLPEKECIIILDNENNLLRLDEKQSLISEDIEYIAGIDNYAGYLYTKSGSVYAAYGKKSYEIGVAEDMNYTKPVIYSRKKFFYQDENGILYSIDKRQKDKKSYGNVIFYSIM